MRAPMPFRWTGLSMEPLPRFQRLADRDFVVGEVYTLDLHEERSSASHRHYFAVLHDLWLNLPEAYGADFPTDDHLRKYALIKAGYFNSHSIVCKSKAEALRTAGFIKPIDGFAIVAVEGKTVTRFTAKSQSVRAMGKADFQASKDAVLDIVANMVGASLSEMGAAA